MIRMTQKLLTNGGTRSLQFQERILRIVGVLGIAGKQLGL
jgi:hypothetical protein